MKLGKMLSVGEVVEHVTDESAVPAHQAAVPAPAPEVAVAPRVAERPAPVVAHADH